MADIDLGLEAVCVRVFSAIMGPAGEFGSLVRAASLPPRPPIWGAME